MTKLENLDTRRTTEDSHFENFTRFAGEFKSESDRAAVILGAAKLDVLLYQILHIALRPCVGKNDDLLDGDSPLSTFSSRIALCHRLGLIDDEITRSLNLIRKIRNSFAHEIGNISLTSGPHRDRITELVSPVKSHSCFSYLIKTFFNDDMQPSTLFRAMIALLSLRLTGAVDRGNKAYLSQPLSLVPRSWDIAVNSDSDLKAEKTPSPKSEQDPSMGQ